MAKKPTRSDYKKKVDRLKKDLEKVRTRQKELAEKEKELIAATKEAEAEYVLFMLKETDTPVSLLEDLLVTDNQGGNV
ncbi:hypothetical protein [Streptococcus canis]|uniref:Uncharacterized protein n=1 Tax=Streptococcus canis FSL Z3-227 TaxID=482234 RepID=A0AAV3FUS3_STRCB|nr:hypothetical protein [Streptococcus canis]EIQ82679.1 hypothetical protein SCAZ3_09970 [Streptococcus canis FSL Z3-227]